MTAPGQSRHFGYRPTTSGLPLETDIVRAGRHVSKVPLPDSCAAAKLHLYSITSSARARIDGGIVRLSILAVLRFNLISNLVGA